MYNKNQQILIKYSMSYPGALTHFLIDITITIIITTKIGIGKRNFSSMNRKRELTGGSCEIKKIFTYKVYLYLPERS
jgi:hypothetical protein